MKTITVPLFSYSELSPDAQKRVVSRIAENEEVDFSEMSESLKALCEACNLRLVDYQYGAYCRNHKVKVSGNAEYLEGRKALAWFLQILIQHGYPRPARFAEMTFPGVCGFTGVCYDDDLAETLRKSLLDGADVGMAFDSLSYTLNRMAESELEYLQSEEWILETLDQSAEIYTEEGDEY